MLNVPAVLLSRINQVLRTKAANDPIWDVVSNAELAFAGMHGCGVRLAPIGDHAGHKKYCPEVNYPS